MFFSRKKHEMKKTVFFTKGPPGNPPHQSQKAPRMARTYPLTVPYNQCLGARADPL